MRVALTVADFMDRAALVYGHRTAAVDEPDAAGSFGDEVAALGGEGERIDLDEEPHRSDRPRG